MTKRLAGLTIAAVAAATFALPAAPAQAAGCVSLATTPVECIKEMVVANPDLPDCVYYGTFPLVCLPAAS